MLPGHRTYSPSTNGILGAATYGLCPGSAPGRPTCYYRMQMLSWQSSACPLSCTVTVVAIRESKIVCSSLADQMHPRSAQLLYLPLPTPSTHLLPEPFPSLC